MSLGLGFRLQGFDREVLSKRKALGDSAFSGLIEGVEIPGFRIWSPKAVPFQRCAVLPIAERSEQLVNPKP